MDFTEVAQVAQRVSATRTELPSDAALAIADGIHHLLVDEFQDTSRRQHKLIGALVAAWPDLHGTHACSWSAIRCSRFTSFAMPMPSCFRACGSIGLELPERRSADSSNHVPLSSNFRTTPQPGRQVERCLRADFRGERWKRHAVFAGASRRGDADTDREPRFQSASGFHSADCARLFVRSGRDAAEKGSSEIARRPAHEAQTAEIVALIRDRMSSVEAARARGEKYRIAVLGRTYRTLEPIAQALHDAAIPFRAVDLGKSGRQARSAGCPGAGARAVQSRRSCVHGSACCARRGADCRWPICTRWRARDNAELLRRPVPELLADADRALEHRRAVRLRAA